MVVESPTRVLNDNPTRAQIAAAALSGQCDVVLDANPASVYFGTVMRRGTPGNLQLSFKVPEDCVQGNGVISGGAIASMLDIAMAMAVLSVLSAGRNCATISLSVNMMAPAAVGSLLAEGVIERLGRSVAFSRASLYDASGKRLVATATSSLSIFDDRPVPAGA